MGALGSAIFNHPAWLFFFNQHGSCCRASRGTVRLDMGGLDPITNPRVAADLVVRVSAWKRRAIGNCGRHQLLFCIPKQSWGRDHCGAEMKLRLLFPTDNSVPIVLKSVVRKLIWSGNGGTFADNHRQ